MSTLVTPSDVLKRAHAVGNYYGFSSLSSLTASKKGQGSRSPYPDNFPLDSLDVNAKEVAGLLKQVRDASIVPSKEQPLFVWHSNIAPGRPAPKHIVVQFHIIGVDHAIADAVLIRAVRSFVTDISLPETNKPK